MALNFKLGILIMKVSVWSMEIGGWTMKIRMSGTKEPYLLYSSLVICLQKFVVTLGINVYICS